MFRPAKAAAIENWLAVRNKVLTDESEPEIHALRKTENGYDYFLNCTAGAFENAGKKFAARIADYTINADVKDWMRAQDQVLANCSETRTMPAEAAVDAPVWLKNDRDYQIARRLFLCDAL